MAIDPNLLKTYIPNVEDLKPDVFRSVRNQVGTLVDDGYQTHIPSVLQSGSPEEINSEVYPPYKAESKYDMTQHTYPEDLFAEDSRYGGMYVVFYVNVQEDSKLAQTNPVLIIPDSEVTKGKGSQITKRKVTSGQLTGSLAGLGAIAGTAVGSIIGVGGAGGVTGTALGALVGGAQTVVKTEQFSENEKSPKYTLDQLTGINLTKQTKRIKTAIALYTPNDLMFKYGVNWGDDDTLILQAALEAGEDIKNTVADIMKGDTSSMSLSGALGNGYLQGLALKAAQAAGADGLSALTGTAPNPRKEQIFNGVDFRTHQFLFRFWIRSETEHINVKNIIREFKYHMHPEFKDGNEYIFLYPSEFDIQFYYKDKESDELPKYTSCVLTDVSSNYTPNGVFNLLKQGKPAEITLNLMFRELAILTKEDIEKGY